MNIDIIVPYQNVELFCEIWANSEKNIDFFKDFSEAARCTVCFGAVEIKTWLQKYNITCSFHSEMPSDSEAVIQLAIEDPMSKSEEYTLSPISKGVRIFGKGKAGVLYGCYELLKMQGFHWYAPGLIGTVVPSSLSMLTFPSETVHFKPDMDFGRGFDHENYSIESAETWLWMARNRLNIGGYSPKFYHLQKKLCITIKTGGHIFEKMLNPQRVLDNGKTLFEGHKDWYGVRKDGTEITPENCLKTQFCVSNKELIQFLSNELIHMFRNEWKYVERADIWGFDTWGNTCNCDSCRQLGNATDITLHFLAELRRAINQTDIKDRVRLISCSYEGTATIEPPTRPIPQELLDASDCVVFYPIMRCYAHDFSDKACPTNDRYNTWLQGWFQSCDTMPIIMGEYYNVSKFEDLPLVFTKRIQNDIPYYFKNGVRGITYMHFPLMNMGIRSLTHLLYAQLSWDTNADCKELMDTYFASYYERYSHRMQEAYRLIEDAFQDITRWRSWGGVSVLQQLRKWDGHKPANPLKADTHLPTHEDVISAGERSVSALNAALQIVESVMEEDMLQEGALSLSDAVNPVALREVNEQEKLTKRITEARCFLIYGLDTLSLMTLMVKLYDAMSRDEHVDLLIQELASLYKKMDSYYIPVSSDALVRDTVCKTGLERTQLKTIAKKCIAMYLKQ